MANTRNVFKTVVIIGLALFVFFVAVPILLKLVGFTVALLIWLAVKLIYLAVVAAVAYLVLVGIRALLR